MNNLKIRIPKEVLYLKDKGTRRQIDIDKGVTRLKGDRVHKSVKTYTRKTKHPKQF